MVVHMHMQMPLLIVVGMLMTPLFKRVFFRFFEKWNINGIPGIVLFMIIVCYWMIPRTMDEALTTASVEIFKFISLPFLAGIPLRSSWNKLTAFGKSTVYVILSILFGIMAWIYIFTPNQICNNYLIAEQKALGWAFFLTGICIMIYFIQTLFINKTDYEEDMP